MAIMSTTGTFQPLTFGHDVYLVAWLKNQTISLIMFTDVVYPFIPPFSNSQADQWEKILPLNNSFLGNFFS